MTPPLFAGTKSVSTLGLGTAQLARFHAPADMRRLLDTALDLGITHFDTARAYGHGCMEAFCAPFFQRHRDKITLTTKAGLGHFGTSAGISRTGTATGNQGALRFAFACRKVLARLRRGGQARPPALTAAELERSLTTSLRELRTDHIDCYLLHEHTPAQALPLLPDLSRFQQQGKILRFGIASYHPAFQEGETPETLRQLPPGFILQSNMGTLACPLPERFAACPRITHSVHTGTRDHTLSLAHALGQNPGGVVLVGTRSPQHLAEAVRVATSTTTPPA